MTPVTPPVPQPPESYIVATNCCPSRHDSSGNVCVYLLLADLGIVMLWIFVPGWTDHWTSALAHFLVTVSGSAEDISSRSVELRPETRLTSPL